MVDRSPGRFSERQARRVDKSDDATALVNGSETGFGAVLRSV
jgi:hypothetical protein